MFSFLFTLFFCVHLLTSTHTRLDKKYSKHTNNWKITKTKLKCTRTKRSSNNSKQNRDRKRIIYKTTIDNHSNFSKQKINFRTFSLCVFIDKLFPLHHHTDELKMNKKTLFGAFSLNQTSIRNFSTNQFDWVLWAFLRWSFFRNWTIFHFFPSFTSPLTRIFQWVLLLFFLGAVSACVLMLSAWFRLVPTSLPREIN